MYPGAARVDRGDVSTDRELLEALCVADPWSSSWEGLDDTCVFCGSDDRTDPGGTFKNKYRHEPDCAWIRAMDHLERPHPDHTNEPRPPRPDSSIVCDQCDRTFDAHMAHLGLEAGRAFAAAKEAQLLELIIGGRPVADHYPIISVPRGGIRYFIPPVIPGA